MKLDIFHAKGKYWEKGEKVKIVSLMSFERDYGVLLKAEMYPFGKLVQNLK